MTDRTEHPITPDTRVGELLDAYPKLEAVLIEISPAFAKLKNPLLRRTVARVTTLQQAARVGGVSVGEMVNRLRNAAGLAAQDELSEPIDSTPSTTRPAWCRPKEVVMQLDAGPLLDRGEKPVGRVLKELERLPDSGSYELTAPFAPIPLIDLAVERAFEAWWSEEAPGVVKVYFRKPPIETS